LFVENENDRVPTLTTVNVPKGVNGPAVCKYMMEHFNIEVAGGLGGALYWRVGLMGMNSTKEIVDILMPKFLEACNAKEC